jgi:hypothetical protein
LIALVIIAFFLRKRASKETNDNLST